MSWGSWGIQVATEKPGASSKIEYRFIPKLVASHMPIQQLALFEVATLSLWETHLTLRSGDSGDHGDHARSAYP